MNVDELARRHTFWLGDLDAQRGPFVALTCAERDALVVVVQAANRHCRELDDEELCRALDALSAVPRAVPPQSTVTLAVRS